MLRDTQSLGLQARIGLRYWTNELLAISLVEITIDYRN